MHTNRSLLVLPSLLALQLLACGGQSPPARSASDVSTGPTSADTSSDVASIAPETTTTGASPASPEPATPPAPTEAQAPNADLPLTFSDAEILQITHAANQGEIAQATLAQHKSQDPKVRKLAAMMLKDHLAADAKCLEIAKKESLVPAESATSSTIDKDAGRATSTLRSERGRTFDRDYVDTQVKEHQAVLTLIDDRLLVDAKDPDVRAFLTEVRAKVALHLQHAVSLQTAMQK
jgi:putative membrane protein